MAEEDHDDESLLDFFDTFELVALIATIECSNGSSLVSLFQYLSVNYSNCGFILGYLHFLAKECFMRKWPDTNEITAFFRQVVKDKKGGPIINCTTSIGFGGQSLQL